MKLLALMLALCVSGVHVNPFLPMCPLHQPAPGPGPLEADGFFGHFRVKGESLSLASIEVMVVLVYAPWCPFSQQLLPIFGNVSRAFPHLSFLQIDGDREWRFSSRHMIRGFPLILIFRNGKLTDQYDGERTVTGLFDFFQSLSGEPPALLPADIVVVPVEPQDSISWLLVVSYIVTIALAALKCVQLRSWYYSETPTTSSKKTMEQKDGDEKLNEQQHSTISSSSKFSTLIDEKEQSELKQLEQFIEECLLTTPSMEHREEGGQDFSSSTENQVTSSSTQINERKVKEELDERIASQSISSARDESQVLNGEGRSSSTITPSLDLHADKIQASNQQQQAEQCITPSVAPSQNVSLNAQIETQAPHSSEQAIMLQHKETLDDISPSATYSSSTFSLPLDENQVSSSSAPIEQTDGEQQHNTSSTKANQTQNSSSSTLNTEVSTQIMEQKDATEHNSPSRASPSQSIPTDEDQVQNNLEQPMEQMSGSSEKQCQSPSSQAISAITHR